MHKKQSEPRSVVRKRAVTELKRSLILEAARVVFEREGLARANIRQIAAQAGYTPGAIYFHYASKEEIYAELLAQSLDRLHQHTRQSRDLHRAPGERLRAAALAFFDYYATHPRELEMGFYLFGGIRPVGLTPELDARLNAQLRAALALIEATIVECGATPSVAARETASLFAHAVGLLILEQTKRVRLFRVEARSLFLSYVEALVERLREANKRPPKRRQPP
ncbi:TetR/AcrR family transcriptional regulator [Pelomicrobium methylotrophicum]|uniref:TetR/AcrR family transcriptional regulator n=1 Tax=Pelomicrobium methylotrophicum TaxID=2602750 RepID=A0A5C7EMR7_9PROT|nr:TetR/AcrR family transcriptional regulator [Pelomicrobium methylotrophicum]TXF12816.1 TetR/AcrR family transcriptional regulator [Pelomicrobium methylotrophicum]